MTRSPSRRFVCSRRLAASAFGAALLVLAASCRGSSDGGSDGTVLTGTASGGAPLVAGLAHVVDARGSRRSAPVDAGGAFRIDATGLAAPLLVEVTGMIGGRPSTLHSVALDGELGGNVDVTPLTELLTAWALQRDPHDTFNAASPDLSSLTADRVKAGEQLVATKARALLESFGAGDVNVRTGALGGDGTGMNGALHAVKLTPVQGPGRMVYELKVLGGGAVPALRAAAGAGGAPATVLDPAALDTTSVGTLDSGSQEAIQDVLPQVNAQLQGLAARFASGVPAQAEVASFFAGETAFTHNGLHLTPYLTKVLLTQPYVGMQITKVAVEQVVDAENVVVSYSVLFAQPAFPRAETTRMTLVGGKWLLAGNGAIAAVGVHYLARLFSKPLTLEEVQARSDMAQCGDAYCMNVLGFSGSATHDGRASMGRPDEESFGVLAYAGGTSAGVDWRFLARRFSRFVGIPNGRVRPYVVFDASSVEVDPRVDHVVVTGPGLPEAGLTLVQPRPTVPRPYMPIQGDYMDWNSFSSDRCQHFGASAPPGCALDWSEVVAGATYHYSFRDASGAELGTADPRLLGRPRSPEEWFAGKDLYFPQLRLPADAAFTLMNVLDDSEGAPFGGGGSVTVAWSAPTDAQVGLESLWVWRNYFVNDDTSSAANERKESHTYSLVGSTATSQRTTYEAVAWRTSWAWATLTSRDLYGNSLENELSPVNPVGAPCDAQNGPPVCQEKAFRLPPTTKAPRTYPKLVNYFHRMDRAEAQIAGREDYLAQWDVVILNPQNVTDQGLDLARVRAVNPAIEILAWIPVGQSSGDFEMSQTMPDLDSYFLTTAGGPVIRWAWGGYLMNPYKNGYAFVDHVADFVEAKYLVPGGYDGIMFDCLFDGAPRFLSPTVDVDENGVDDWRDDVAFREGVTHLLTRLRTEVPWAILTGNNAFPWSEGSPYYTRADGDMRENAFGDAFGLGSFMVPDDGSDPYGFFGDPAVGWVHGEWDTYGKAMGRITSTTPYFFVQADTQYGRTACVGGGDCGLDSVSLSGLSHDDRRRFRFALTTTLLRDGYFAFDRGDGLHGQLFWFPEYDVDLGTPAPGYERTSATGSFRQDAYGAGTYSREFSNGTVVVNPTATARQVTFPQTRTDASTGQAGTSFHLPAWDGRMYMK